MTSFTKACYNAALELQQLLIKTEHTLGCQSVSKGAGGDISIQYDLLAEDCFVQHLSSFGQILSEEGGYIGTGRDLIILDPIDGSDNLKSNFPYYGASIALQKEGVTVVGFVCNFANGDCFIREEGELYQCSLSDNKMLKVVVNPESKVGIFEKASQHLNLSKLLIDEHLKFRAPGAVALSLAYAHSVKFMVFAGKARQYDVAAGLYLCEDLYTYFDEDILIISHNKDIFAKILRIFNLSDKQR